MLIAPTLKDGLSIELQGQEVSFPYLELTAAIMKDAGADVQLDGKIIRIKEGKYNLNNYPVEADWSSASYWYEIAAINQSSALLLHGYRKDSLQGDSRIADIFLELGVETQYQDGGILLKGTGNVKRSIDLNLSGQPDLVPAITATCAALGVKARISGVAHLRYKESDRIEVLSKELGKTGAVLSFHDDILDLLPGQADEQKIPLFETHGDHRLAFCLSPLALIFNAVDIADPDVVEKSYPDFWDHLESSGLFTVEKK
jgi:3-phosphoshikimate 1-carboxyvinyltransferase